MIPFYLQKLLHGSRHCRFIRHVRVERVHQPRHPADAALEETELQSRKAVEHTAEDQARRAHHVGQGKAERGGKMLVSLKTFAADQPRMAMLQFEDTRRRMQQDWNIEIGDFFVERKQHFVVEVAVAPTAIEFDRLETEFLDRAAQLFNRFLNIGQ